jgi:hypothetical protein
MWLLLGSVSRVATVESPQTGDFSRPPVTPSFGHLSNNDGRCRLVSPNWERCRRRDSNPRHADYDSSRAVAWGVVRARKRRQMGVFASSGPGVVALNGVGGVCTLFAPSTDRCSRWRRALSRSTVGRSIPNDVVPFTRERSRVAVLSRCCFRGSKLQRRVARSGVRLMRKLRGSFPLDAWQKYPAALVAPGALPVTRRGRGSRRVGRRSRGERSTRAALDAVGCREETRTASVWLL